MGLAAEGPADLSGITQIGAKQGIVLPLFPRDV